MTSLPMETGASQGRKWGEEGLPLQAVLLTELRPPLGSSVGGQCPPGPSVLRDHCEPLGRLPKMGTQGPHRGGRGRLNPGGGGCPHREEAGRLQGLQQRPFPPAWFFPLSFKQQVTHCRKVRTFALGSGRQQVCRSPGLVCKRLPLWPQYSGSIP